jgi:LysR family transcriptional regulator, low CO2-responsive transcriptional regulator
MISLDHLKTLAFFVKTGSMAAAARELGLTQPAVSMQLKALEASCPEPVFLMDGTHKVLSPFGRRLHEMSSLAILDLSKKTSDFIQKPETEIISIAGRDHILERIVGSANRLIGSVEFLPCSGAVATKKVANLEATFGISYEIPETTDLIAKKLFSSRAILGFSSKSFASFQKKNMNSLSAEDLLKNKILAYRRDDPALIQLCKKKNVRLDQLNFGMIAPSWEVLRQAAINGHGIVLIPSEYVKENDELSFIELTDQQITKFDYYLLYSKHTSYTVIGRKWINFITSVWN